MKKYNLTKKDFDASIICCIFNEVGLIETKLVSFIKKIKNEKKKFEIIVIDNNSTDGTREKLKNLKKKKLYRYLSFIFNDRNLGKGGSIKKASRVSRGRYCCVFDIDEYYVEDLLKGIKLAKNKSIDLIIGSRINEKKKYIYKTNYYGVRFLTFLINIFFNTNLSDTAGAIKIFNRKKYKEVLINTSGFDFEFELICKFAKKNFHVSEFYSKYNPRTFAEGKKLVAWKDGLKILVVILKNIF